MAQSLMEDATAKTDLSLSRLPQGRAASAMAPPASSHQTEVAMPVQQTSSPLQWETATTDASASEITYGALAEELAFVKAVSQQSFSATVRASCARLPITPTSTEQS